MKCTSCGCDNREGAKFCGECAAPLAAALACPRCGTANPKVESSAIRADSHWLSSRLPILAPTRRSTGTLSPIGHFPTEKTPRGFNIDPRGRFLLSVGLDSSAMTVYRIDAQTGALANLKH